MQTMQSHKPVEIQTRKIQNSKDMNWKDEISKDIKQHIYKPNLKTMRDTNQYKHKAGGDGTQLGEDRVGRLS